MQFWRSFPFKIILFIGLWAGALEILCRIFLVSPSNVIPDQQLGWMFRPNSSARIETSEAGFRRISVNEFGLNDATLAPRGSRLRILVLGDSYVEAFQVPRSQNFVSLLGEGKSRFQLINGGRSGLDPLSESAMLDKLGPDMRPDGVILVVNDGDQSDLLSDGILLTRCGQSSKICDLRAPPPSTHSSAEWKLLGLCDRSALLTYLLRRFREPIAEEAHAVVAFIHRAALPLDDSHATGTYRQTDFEPLLEFEFAKIVKRLPLLVIAVPDTDFGSNGKTTLADGGKFERAVESAAAAAGASYLDAGPVLAAAYARDRQPPRGFEFTIPGKGHLNAAGHAALAKAIGPKLDAFLGAHRG